MPQPDLMEDPERYRKMVDDGVRAARDIGFFCPRHPEDFPLVWVWRRRG